jgi:ABC-type multidrug transport system fused ATPase/permease subunit
MYILKILFSFLKQKKISVLLYVLFTILSFPLESIVVPQIYSHFFEILTAKSKGTIFLKYFTILAVILIIVNGSNSITTYIESYIIPELCEYVINFIFKNLLIKYQDTYKELELAKIITRLSTIPHYLKDIVTHFCVWIFPRLLAIIIINIYFFILNWKLGLVSVLLLIIFFGVSITFFNICSPLSNKRHISFESKNQYAQDKLSNTFSIYSMGNIKKEINNYEENTKKYTNIYKENLFCLTKSSITSSIYIIILFIALNAFSTYLFLNKELSYVNLVAIFITVIYYLPCVITISSTIPDIIHNYGALSAIDDFIEDLYNIDQTKNLNISDETEKLINSGNIIINKLDFGYEENSYLFKNFYLTIKENEKIAIVGPSGNGKSTLIKLIMGYYKVPNNMIFIDNIDINNYNLNDLRKQISYVNQNSKLFHMSLIENLQYGNNLSREDIIKLCDKINVTNIFKNLIRGFDTDVGVEGNSLSGGQKQLVHIIRCIANKNKIIILDEPTSAIDKKNTDSIISAIKELSKNSTLILITHDSDILSLVDRVVTINSGKIIEDKYINNN